MNLSLSNTVFFIYSVLFSGNKVPLLNVTTNIEYDNNQPYLHVTRGEENSFTVAADDDGDTVYIAVADNSTGVDIVTLDSKTANVRLLLLDSMPINLRYTVSVSLEVLLYLISFIKGMKDQ